MPTRRWEPRFWCESPRCERLPIWIRIVSISMSATITAITTKALSSVEPELSANPLPMVELETEPDIEPDDKPAAEPEASFDPESGLAADFIADCCCVNWLAWKILRGKAVRIEATIWLNLVCVASWSSRPSESAFSCTSYFFLLGAGFPLRSVLRFNIRPQVFKRFSLAYSEPSILVSFPNTYTANLQSTTIWQGWIVLWAWCNRIDCILPQCRAASKTGNAVHWHEVESLNQ